MQHVIVNFTGYDVQSVAYDWNWNTNELKKINANARVSCWDDRRFGIYA